MSNKEIREAKDELYRLSRNSKERELYYLREKSLRDEISALANAKMCIRDRVLFWQY